MEQAGLVAALVVLPFNLDACLNLWSRLNDLVRRDDDLKFYGFDLRIQKSRLEHVVAEISKQEVNPRTTILPSSGQRNASQPTTSALSPFLRELVQRIRSSLSEAYDLIERHEPGENVGAVRGAARWSTSDRKEIQLILDRLTHVNSQLLDLMPTHVAERVRAAVACSLFADPEGISPAAAGNATEELPNVQRMLHVFHDQQAVAALHSQALSLHSGVGSSASPMGNGYHPDPKQFHLDFTSLRVVEPLSDNGKALQRFEKELVMISITDNLESEQVKEMPGLVEWRPSLSTSESAGETKSRMDSLVRSLILMADAQAASANERNPGLGTFDFGALKPMGWTSPSRVINDRLGIVYSFLDHSLGEPICLHDHITNTQKTPNGAPSLGFRFQIARQLSMIISNLFLIGCRHKNLRASNILFFEQSKAKSIHLVGFADSRSAQEDDEFCGKNSSLVPYDSNDDLYRPLCVRNLNDSDGRSPHWQSRWDIYSLGILLLEIGLWRTASQMRRRHQQLRDRDSEQNIIGMHEFHSNTVPREVEKLPFRVGSIYADVTKECLRYGSNNQEGNAPREAGASDDKGTVRMHLLFLAGTKAKLAGCCA